MWSYQQETVSEADVSAGAVFPNIATNVDSEAHAEVGNQTSPDATVVSELSQAESKQERLVDVDGPTVAEEGMPEPNASRANVPSAPDLEGTEARASSDDSSSVHAPFTEDPEVAEAGSSSGNPTSNFELDTDDEEHYRASKKITDATSAAQPAESGQAEWESVEHAEDKNLEVDKGAVLNATSSAAETGDVAINSSSAVAPALVMLDSTVDPAHDAVLISSHTTNPTPVVFDKPYNLADKAHPALLRINTDDGLARPHEPAELKSALLDTCKTLVGESPHQLKHKAKDEQGQGRSATHELRTYRGTRRRRRASVGADDIPTPHNQFSLIERVRPVETQRPRSEGQLSPLWSFWKNAPSLWRQGRPGAI